MIQIPDEIRSQLDAGAALAVSISGGKDSQALLAEMVKIRHLVRGEFFAIHADLGRAEWKETPAFVEALCERYDIPLVIVRRKKGDLLQRIEDRYEQLKGTGRPFWPSASNRYCTSDQKREPIDKYLRKFDDVICAIGIRREESAARKKKCEMAPRARIETNSRRAIDWLPILDYTLEDVWQACGTTGDEVGQARQAWAEAGQFVELPVHPAYAYGNERLSCSLCVLGCRGDLENGARHNPEAFEFLLQMEEESGITFKKGFALSELKRD